MFTHDPNTLDTIGKLIDRSYRLALYCDNDRGGVTCGFVKWADLHKLAARLGRDHGCMHDEIAPHLWCPQCGGKQVSLRLHPPGLQK